MNEERPVKKIVPSRLEKAIQQFLYRHLGDRIPERITPTQITLAGALGGLCGILCALLSRFSPYWLAGTVAGIVTHLVCDDLDGYIARKKGMTSRSGAYLDLLTDILHITLLIMALCYAGRISFEAGILLTPVYALIIFTAMNSILYLGEFPFPRVGPAETHLFFIGLCLLCMSAAGTASFTLFTMQIRITDGVFLAGGSVMIFEMVRLQIRLYCRLRKEDHV